MRRSGITKPAVKIRVPEVVALETVTHYLFFFSVVDISARGKVIVLEFWDCQAPK